MSKNIILRIKTEDGTIIELPEKDGRVMLFFEFPDGSYPATDLPILELAIKLFPKRKEEFDKIMQEEWSKPDPCKDHSCEKCKEAERQFAENKKDEGKIARTPDGGTMAVAYLQPHYPH
jgi:hypothetical protein